MTLATLRAIALTLVTLACLCWLAALPFRSYGG